MINKKTFNVKNTRKVLHKVGKKWVVMLAVLLGLVAGGAALTSTHSVAMPQLTVEAHAADTITASTSAIIPNSQIEGRSISASGLAAISSSDFVQGLNTADSSATSVSSSVYINPLNSNSLNTDGTTKYYIQLDSSNPYDFTNQQNNVYDIYGTSNNMYNSTNTIANLKIANLPSEVQDTNHYLYNTPIIVGTYTDGSVNPLGNKIYSFEINSDDSLKNLEVVYQPEGYGLQIQYMYNGQPVGSSSNKFQTKYKDTDSTPHIVTVYNANSNPTADEAVVPVGYKLANGQSTQAVTFDGDNYITKEVQVVPSDARDTTDYVAFGDGAGIVTSSIPVNTSTTNYEYGQTIDNSDLMALLPSSSSLYGDQPAHGDGAIVLNGQNTQDNPYYVLVRPNTVQPTFTGATNSVPNVSTQVTDPSVGASESRTPIVNRFLETITLPSGSPYYFAKNTPFTAHGRNETEMMENYNTLNAKDYIQPDDVIRNSDDSASFYLNTVTHKPIVLGIKPQFKDATTGDNVLVPGYKQQIINTQAPGRAPVYQETINLPSADATYNFVTPQSLVTNDKTATFKLTPGMSVPTFQLRANSTLNNEMEVTFNFKTPSGQTIDGTTSATETKGASNVSASGITPPTGYVIPSTETFNVPTDSSKPVTLTVTGAPVHGTFTVPVQLGEYGPIQYAHVTASGNVGSTQTITPASLTDFTKPVGYNNPTSFESYTFKPDDAGDNFTKALGVMVFPKTPSLDGNFYYVPTIPNTVSVTTPTATQVTTPSYTPVEHKGYTVPITHYNAYMKPLTLKGVANQPKFYVSKKAMKVSAKAVKHGKVLSAYYKGGKVVYTVKVGKLVGKVYGKTGMPKLTFKKGTKVYVGKKAVKLTKKTFKKVHVVSAVRKGDTVKYTVKFNKKTGVIYAKLAAEAKMYVPSYVNLNSRYHQYMPKISKAKPFYVHVTKDLLVHTNKHFTKKNGKKVLKKGTDLKVVKLESYHHMTRFLLSNGTYITGLKGYVEY